MATTTSLTTTYAGQDAKLWVKAALLSGNTLANDGLTVLPNVKYKAVVHKLATDGILKDASCDFTATSTVTITERIITPKELQVNLQLCKRDFKNSWSAEEMGMSAHDVLPRSFADYLVSYVAEKVAASVETSIWQGVTGTSGQFDGFKTLLAADASLPAAQEVAGTTVTASNIITELRKITAAIPDAIFGREDLYIYLSINMYKAYIQALGGFSVAATSNNGVDAKGTQWYNGQSLTFDGVKLFVANGLPADTAIATTKDNLFFGCGLLDDANIVKVLDMAELDGSENCRIIMRMTAAVQYHSVSDIVTYGITNAAN